MFVHQVIEDLFDGFQWGKDSVNDIIAAIKFSFGDVEADVYDSIRNRFLGKTMWLDDLYIKLPYPKVWIDFVFPSCFPRKYGVLMYEIKADVYNFIFKFFCFGVDNKWSQGPIGSCITPGVLVMNDGSKKACSELRAFADEAEIADWFVGNITVSEYHKLMSNILSFVNTGLLLISCKNITTEIIPAPEKLNKKRIKQGKQPLFSYHTLVIKPVGKRQESIPKHLWENRIHLQRGHFKTYTAEKPLFGHITGRFWWQPHVRGRNKDGVVMKDYEVKHEQAGH